MRIVLAVLLCLIAGASTDTARADQYRWCAVYAGGENGGGINCYFVTLQQCQWAISGVGGLCRPSPYANGGPAGPPPRAQRKKS